ncbi:putative manganese transporter [Pseudarthrobacter sp. TAF60_1]|uniref:putative manganese transporter n=1 Tax=Pseudarthrobacter sp. TAF60_1 TaxID=3233071 RepID=UPI003F9921B9
MVIEVLTSLSDAFMSIGVYVMVLSSLGAWANRRYGARITTHLAAHPRLGPLLGALVTLPPGCLGVLAVARLYSRDGVSQGTLLAAFLATMGDSAWVLLAVDPFLALVLKAAMVLIGTVSGYLTDRNFARTSVPLLVAAATKFAGLARSKPAYASAVDADRVSPRHTVLALAPRPEAAVSLQGAQKPVPHDKGKWWRRTYMLIGYAALPLSLLVTFQILTPDDVAAMAGGADVYSAVGITGFVAAGVMMWQHATPRSCGECSGPGSITTVGLRESAHVTVWAGAAFAGWHALSSTEWFLALSSLPISGALAVLIAAILGLIPACGVELAVAGLFVAGGLPLFPPW